MLLIVPPRLYSVTMNRFLPLMMEWIARNFDVRFAESLAMRRFYPTLGGARLDCRYQAELDT
ncbi:hypothetical protein BDV38DRAFT_235228 [Aspergillus pseudotamarii]|uniref:Uncharacterized protein n=1 Tax=Aspergillus pseudotamarii TaxID=132259 RepID=A0A5N6T8U1_ASPPS|nr:uncharacterized protein BDV38DRAFT_235228 [Aspergillus pseudotamarii]KAE8142591.1 hypothetical protein BDV38DRAFT_235228 [Aspergillus pseudotamarii]